MNSVPEEILLHIANFLWDPGRRREDLLSFIQCAKLFYRIGIPLLYCSVTFGDGPNIVHWLAEDSSHRHHLLQHMHHISVGEPKLWDQRCYISPSTIVETRTFSMLSKALTTTLRITVHPKSVILKNMFLETSFFTFASMAEPIIDLQIQSCVIDVLTMEQSPPINARSLSILNVFFSDPVTPNPIFLGHQVLTLIALCRQMQKLVFEYDLALCQKLESQRHLMWPITLKKIQFEPLVMWGLNRAEQRIMAVATIFMINTCTSLEEFTISGYFPTKEKNLPLCHSSAKSINVPFDFIAGLCYRGNLEKLNILHSILNAETISKLPRLLTLRTLAVSMVVMDAPSLTGLLHVFPNLVHLTATLDIFDTIEVRNFFSFPDGHLLMVSFLFNSRIG
ncbi:hypothetical protein GYMLUDRAFT_63256 [Collybiopsis luxurians FD-317 M1]|uniref:Uncharacterized protein n=1 Tax=Collybiopsis luxurians FD-317 M1 TaxID=944289 RepID=A0A0D0C8M4_9AGAR|nr:hypothetical protein GYMLUDRAFT_63256 [Collybiopsis luxurians FD-317 M1]